MGRASWRDVWLLSACWCFGVAAVFIQISTTTLFAAGFYDKSLSTVPLGTLLGSSALCTLVVPHLRAEWGDSACFLFGALLGTFGAVLNLLAVVSSVSDDGAFSLLIWGAIPQGFAYTCTNALRFAVGQFAPARARAQAVALVVLGGALAAFIGPEASKHLRNAFDTEFVGNYMLLVGCYVCLGIAVALVNWGGKDAVLDATAISSLRRDRSDEHLTSVVAEASGCGDEDDDHGDDAGAQPPRPLAEIAGNPTFLFSLFAQAVSYSAMGGLMTAVPLAMKDDGHGFNASTSVIMGHMLGMFLPSLVSGGVIARVGHWVSIMGGFVVLLAGAVIFYAGDSVAVYAAGIAVVGVGWNFSFVGSSALFGKLYFPSEKTRVQTLNDLVVIGALAIAASTASNILESVGWYNFVHGYVVYICVAVVACVFAYGPVQRAQRAAAQVAPV